MFAFYFLFYFLFFIFYFVKVRNIFYVSAPRRVCTSLEIKICKTPQTVYPPLFKKNISFQSFCIILVNLFLFPFLSIRGCFSAPAPRIKGAVVSLVCSGVESMEVEIGLVAVGEKQSGETKCEQSELENE